MPPKYHMELESTKAKVVFQIDVQKITTETMEDTRQCLLKTHDKKSFFLEFETPRESKEWISQFEETKDKQRALSKT